MRAAMLGALIAITSACSLIDGVKCAGIGIVALPVPSDTTINTGQSYTTFAGVGGSCGDGHPIWDKHLFRWAPLDSSVVSAVSLDSSHARITGLRSGSTSITVTMDSSWFGTMKVTVR